jgi:hypothetical protein
LAEEEVMSGQSLVAAAEPATFRKGVRVGAVELEELEARAATEAWMDEIVAEALEVEVDVGVVAGMGTTVSVLFVVIAD